MTAADPDAMFEMPDPCPIVRREREWGEGCYRNEMGGERLKVSCIQTLNGLSDGADVEKVTMFCARERTWEILKRVGMGWVGGVCARVPSIKNVAPWG